MDALTRQVSKCLPNYEMQTFCVRYWRQEKWITIFWSLGLLYSEMYVCGGGSVLFWYIFVTTLSTLTFWKVCPRYHGKWFDLRRDSVLLRRCAGRDEKHSVTVFCNKILFKKKFVFLQSRHYATGSGRSTVYHRAGALPEKTLTL